MIAVDRRGALLGAGAAALACLTTTGRAAAKPRFGLAEITVMPELLRDYAGTLEQVAAMGYRVMGFRLHGYGGPSADEPTPAQKARLVRAAGLELGVVRLNVRSTNHDRELGEAADIGAKIVALSTAAPFISGPKMFETTRAAFDAWPPQIAALGENANKRGLTLAYHNHWFDLLPLGGERPLDVMARQIPAEILSFEVDLAWTWYAGVAPLDLLRRLGARVVSMHWKDIDRTRGKSITDHAVAPGKGEMNYPALLPQIWRITSATGFVEVDSTDDGLAAARQGAEVVRRALAFRR
jgi:sugar phosphate isomerase/epimerase